MSSTHHVPVLQMWITNSIIFTLCPSQQYLKKKKKTSVKNVETQSQSVGLGCLG